MSEETTSGSSEIIPEADTELAIPSWLLMMPSGLETTVKLAVAAGKKKILESTGGASGPRSQIPRPRSSGPRAGRGGRLPSQISVRLPLTIQEDSTMTVNVDVNGMLLKVN